MMTNTITTSFSKKVFLFILGIFLLPNFVFGQTAQEDIQGIWRAEVTSIISFESRDIPGTDAVTDIQTIQAKILEGERKGEIIQLENDFVRLKDNQKFYLNYLITEDGNEIYSVEDVDRRSPILFLTLLFVAVVLLFGRLQGLRSLLSLLGSLFVIIFVLIPLLIKGYNPVLISILIGSLILFVAIFFTHGFNIRSLTAFLGTIGSVAITGLLAFFAIDLLSLSGFFSDETVYLNFGTNGLLDFKGLLLGGIIIGVLGVLDDIAITQVSVVSELKKNSEDITNKNLFSSAMNVGREHVSALVNTIVLAYAGVSLPLLLWLSQSGTSFEQIINNEIFATEIARTIVGSIGLILTVPITTYLAVLLVDKLKNQKSNHSHHHH